MAKGGHIEVAQAYVTIIPSMQGAQKKIAEELVPAAERAGDQAGKRVGDKLGDGASSGGRAAGAKVGDEIAKGAQRGADDAGKGISSSLSRAGDSAAGSIGSKLDGAFSKVSQSVGSVFGGIGSKIGSTLGAAASKVGGAFSGAASKVGSAFSGVASKVAAPFSGISDKIGGAFKDVGSKASSVLGGAGTAGAQSFGGAFSVAAGSLIASGVQEIARIATDTFMQGFNGFAVFEQLSGGVEKIFDQANVSQIFADAQNAYKDLNMSANEYLDSINKVGATFAQTIGDQQGYDTARMGMKAIADYASGTGANLENLNEKYQLITRSSASYQSIADQFAGILPQTSKDFLEQAQQAGFLSDKYTELTQVPVAEYQEAVTKMLQKGVEDMGLAGNTLSESTNTISGSLAMLSGAWDNFLTGLFDENADIGALGENLLQSLAAVVKNVAPRIIGAIGRMIAGLPGAIADLLRGIPDMLGPAITEIFGEGVGSRIGEALGGSFGSFGESLGKLFDSLGKLFGTLMEVLGPVIEAIMNVAGVALEIVMNALTTVISFIADVVIPGIQAFVEFLRPTIELISSIITATMEVIQHIIDAVWPHIQEVVIGAMDAIKPVIENVTNTIKAITEASWPYIQAVIDTAVNAIKGFIDNVWPAIQLIIQNVMAVIQGVINTVWPAIQAIIETVMGAIQAVINTVWPAIQAIVEGAVNGIKAAIDGINACIGVVQGIFDGIRHAIEDPINTARDIVGDAIEAIKGFFNFDIQWPNIPLPHFNVSGSPNPLDWVSQGPPSFSIDWYAKGGFVDGAQLIGAGEAGPEMILPKQGRLMSDFAGAIAARVGDGERTVELLEALLEKQGDVYMDGRRVGHVMAPFVDAEFATNARRAAYA